MSLHDATPETYQPSIPTDLLKQTNERFNTLLNQKEIVWEPYEAEDVDLDGFPVQFQTAPHLRQKPINPVNSKQRTEGSGHNPFLNPEPAFVIARPGPHHTLILNRYPVYRNSLIIHTNEFKLQSDDLDRTDLAACWSTLQALVKQTRGSNSPQSQWVMIYNCGLQAGSSQGHKHMQLWPVPPKDELGFDLFPGRAGSSTDITTIPNVPYKHFILRLPQDASADHIVAAHAKLLLEIKRCHELYGSLAYNVALTTDWLMLVPRRSSGGEWRAGGNTAVVLGLLWITGAAERARWEEFGIVEHLARLGVSSKIS